MENPYQRVPRDGCRVAILALCSIINKDLCEGVRDPIEILTKLKAVYEAQKMLTPEDQHREQAAQNLTQTLICAEAVLKEIGIYDDFKTIVAAIKNHQDPNANNP